MAKIKDPISGFSHAFGAILSIVGLVILVVFASLYGDAYDIVSYTIFGVGLVLLYTFSSLYHLLNLKEKATNVLRKFDHIMIYILIASTYTPICLGVLRGPWGWSIFGVIWGLAVLGTILTSVWLKAPRWLTTGIYLGMGWMVILAIYPMLKTFAVLNAKFTMVASCRRNTLYSWWNNIWPKVATFKKQILWFPRNFPYFHFIR